VQGTLDGTPDAGDLLLQFDPATKYFLWRFEPARGKTPSDALKITKPWLTANLSIMNLCYTFSAHDGVFLFESLAGFLRVTQTAGKATNLDDAQTQALRLLTDDVTRVPGRALFRPTPAHLLLQPLVSKYRVIPPTPFMGYAKVQSMARQADNWVIVVEIAGRVINMVASPDLKISSATVVSPSKQMTWRLDSPY
jgi:hypothetical protein